jgi:hypothetical protein
MPWFCPISRPCEGAVEVPRELVLLVALGLVGCRKLHQQPTDAVADTDLILGEIEVHLPL